MLEIIIYIAYVVLIVVFLVMARQLRFALRHFTPPKNGNKLPAEIDLPSVTVCIPARNETHAMTECLERVVASNYDKLEIIVLDDASVDDTSILIKSFAHAGVRFVQGKALPADWLGKNHALQGLLAEASGSYILFMDVDTRIAPDAIEHLVRYALGQRAAMVSVLPRREDGWRASTISSPLRYFWEIMFHRTGSPATAGNAWLIQRNTLTTRFNGFESLKQVIQPESKLSAALAASGDYRFLMATESLGISYEKKWRSQLATSVRLLFPLLGAQRAIAIMAVLDLSLLLVPVVVVATGIVSGFDWIHGIGLVIVLLYAVLYGFYTHRVWRNSWLIAAIAWPLLIVQEIILVITSMIQYGRKTVHWKGRTVTSTTASL